jgi:nucleotide-binding universal stress UspA family protein
MSGLKDLLVIVDTAPSCERRLELAAMVAARFRAHLTGLFISPPLNVPVTIEGAPIAAEVFVREQRLVAEARERAHQLFDRCTDRPGVSTEWRVAEGEPVDAATLHARYADLTIVGQANPDAPAVVPPDLTERLVLGAGRPVLLVPYAGTFATLGERVLVAWSATREAARAVHDALPLLDATSKVTAVTVVERDRPEVDEQEPAEQLARHLARHGVQAEGSLIVSEDVDVGALLLSRAADLVADLIVMGAYGHSRLREIVLGGATREIFRSMTVPVLMAH